MGERNHSKCLLATLPRGTFWLQDSVHKSIADMQIWTPLSLIHLINPWKIQIHSAVLVKLSGVNTVQWNSHS